MTQGETIRLGFMPLADAAIPIVAARMGFAAAEGLEIALVRETSWANIRDRLAIGHFEAAHLLAPMPIASALGLGPVDVPLVVPMALGLGGNAVTVSARLWQAMAAQAPGLAPGRPAAIGAALKAVIAARRAAGQPRLAFAVVHPYSSHNYELRYWLAACGIDPDGDVEIGIVSPPLMPDALARGGLDGFCVGEPWNAVAAAGGEAVIALAKTDLWSASPEKVLGLRADWAAANAGLVTRLVAAMLEAARWCDDPTNRDALARLLSAPDLIGVPAAQLAPVLSGGIVFAANAATFPWADHARWFAGQMRRWHQSDADETAVAHALGAVCRPDLYRAAAAARGLNVPAIDSQPEATGPVRVPGTMAPMMLYPSRLFDR